MRISQSALDGLGEVVDMLSGADRSAKHRVSFESKKIDVRDIRQRMKMTQKEFAVSFAIPLKTLQNWEQGVSEPDGPSRTLLIVIDSDPASVISALRNFDQQRTRD